MTWWQFSNHAFYPGLVRNFFETLCSCGLQLCSAVRGSLSSLVLIVNTEILVRSKERRSIITQRLLDGRFFHDEFASYAPFAVCQQFR